jgi:asparagine synthase (glutamine-hydrolysing)
MMYRLLKPEPVRQLLEDHRNGRQDNHKLLFSLVMLEQCLRATGRGLAGAPVGSR